MATQVFGWPMSTRDPGFVMFGAMVKKGDDIESVKNKLIETIELSFAKKPATNEEVGTSLAEAAVDYDRALSDPEGFAVDLSDYIALGDWRLFFADRDATAKVTPDAVNTAAATYFVRDNRVVGLFIPDDHPKRAPYMTTPDVKDVIAKATFKEEGDQAEAFDASQDNIDARTERLRIGGVEVALLPKKTRGRTVTVLSNLTTFLAMVYSVIVVPGMLGKAGFPPAAVFVATCLVAGLGSIVMGLWANLPLAIGCAISLTAFTAFSLVLGQQISVPVALGAVFLMGVLFTIISATGIRSWILRNLPQGIAHGTGIGIGLFLLLIAANGVGLVIKNPLDGLPVALGHFATFPVIMSLVGLAVIIGRDLFFEQTANHARFSGR